MFDHIYILIVIVAALGPAFYWFYLRRKAEKSSNNVDFENHTLLAFGWTTLVLVLFMYSSFTRGEKVRDACQSIKERIGPVLSENQWIEVTDGAEWWSICHTSSSDLEPFYE